MIDLNEDNFLIYTLKFYNTPNCIMSEFESDLNRIKYLKRLFKKYRTTGELKERLILNHIILLNNVFGPEATPRILFFKINEKDYDLLKTFLFFLNILPEKIQIKNKTIISEDIPMEMNTIKILRNL